jgi:hypothetical protein
MTAESEHAAIVILSSESMRRPATISRGGF